MYTAEGMIISMLKIHHENNNTDLFYPNKILKSALYVTEVGHSYPIVGYASAKNYRNVFVLHYVISGKGIYYNTPFEGPCGFLMTPDKLQYFSVDSDPLSSQCEQYWIIFSGNESEVFLAEAGFKTTPYVFDVSYMNQVCHIFEELCTSANYVANNDCMYMLSALLQLFSLNSGSIKALESSSNKHHRYIKSVLDFIHTNYASDICEDDIAAITHLSTKYMHRIFRQELGISPIKYLNSYRIKCAKKLLKNHQMPINEIAESVGISDPNYFCRVFQRFNNGISPLQYRNQRKI